MVNLLNNKKKPKWIIFLLLVFFLFLSAYLYFNAMPSYGIKSKTLQAVLQSLLSKDVPKISVQDASTQNGNLLFLDAREKEEYNVSHIANARYVGYKNFVIKNIEDLPKNTKLIVYCSIGKRSDVIAKQLINNGYTNIHNLYGGIFEWVNQSHPVYKGLVATNEVHAYNHFWGQWLHKAVRIY